MNIGFKETSLEDYFNTVFDMYIQMIKTYLPGSKEFNFASEMMRNHLDFMKYNREMPACEAIHG